jgi:hypothetical protein
MRSNFNPKLVKLLKLKTFEVFPSMRFLLKLGVFEPSFEQLFCSMVLKEVDDEDFFLTSLSVLSVSSIFMFFFIFGFLDVEFTKTK